MGSFFERTLGKFFPKKGEEAKAEIHLAAFGKHPGWDDHIEDLGLDTHRLVAVRRVLYLHGIGGNIDSGTWDTADQADRREGYKHLFAWRIGSDLVLGRMWSSRDGKGRTRYPMVVCAQCTGLPLRWALREVLGRLEEIETRCVATTAADDVRSIIADNGQTLRRRALDVEPVHHCLTPSPRTLAKLAARPEMAPSHQGLHRLLYEIEREMSAYLPGSAEAGTSTSRTTLLRPHHMRVPVCADSPEAAIELWLSFLLGQIEPTAPMLLILPLDQPWVDIVVGEPGVQQFYCVRASLKAIPMATEIPYSIDQDFIARVEGSIEASRSGGEEAGEAPPPPLAEPAAQPPAPPAHEPTAQEPAPPPPEPAPPPAPPPPPEPAPPPPAAEPTAPPAPEPVAQEPGPPPPAPEAQAPPATAPAAPPRAEPTPAPPEAEPELPHRAAVPGARPLGKRLLSLWWVLLIIGAAIVLAALAPQLLKLAPGPPEQVGLVAWQPEHAAAWRELCTAYYQWFGRFHDGLSKARLARWSQDPALAAGLVARLEATRGVELDPRRIAGVRGGALEGLGSDPPPGARTAEAIENTRQALEAVRAIDSAIGAWPAAGEASIAALAKQYAGERGWKPQAAQLDALAGAVKPRPGADVAAAIDGALAAKTRLADIEARVARIEGHREAIRVLGDQLADSVARHVAEATRATDTLAALHQTLGESEKLAGDIAAHGRQIALLRKQIASVGDEALAQKFVDSIKASAVDGKDLQSVPAGLGGVKGIAPQIEARLGEIKKQQNTILALEDKALADKLWQCARTRALAALGVMSLHENLAYVNSIAPQITAHRRNIRRHHETMQAVGNDIVTRHGRHVAAGVGSAKDIDALLKNVGESATLADGIISRWSDIQKLQATIEGSGDKMLAQFGTLAAAKARAQADIAALPQTLDQVKTLADSLARLVESDWKTDKIDRTRFTDNSNVHKAFHGELTDALLQQWLTEVKAYYRLDPKADPRLPVTLWDEPLADIAWRISFLTESPEDAKKKLGQQHARRLATLKGKIRAMQQLAWIQENRQTIEQTADALRQEIGKFKADLQGVVQPPKQWLDHTKARKQIASSPAINREWLTRRDKLITPEVTATLLGRMRTIYSRLSRNVRTVQDFLAGLDDAAQLPEGLPDVARKLPGSPTVEAVTKAIAAKRETTLQAVIAAIPWRKDNVPGVPLAAFKQQKAWQDACRQYQAWRQSTGKALVEFRRAEGLLDAGYQLDEPKNAPATIGQLHARWVKQKILDELQEPFEPVVERIAWLQGVGGLNRQQLAATAGRLADDGRPEAVLAVWRRLRLKDDWPGTRAELDAEVALRTRIRKLAARLHAANAARAKALEAELAREGPRQWEACFTRLARAVPATDLQDKDLLFAIQRMKPFNAEVGRLKPQTQLRIYLHDLRDAAARLPADAKKSAVVKPIDAFHKRVTSDLRALAATPAVRSLLQELGRIREHKPAVEPSVGLGKAGPAGSPLVRGWHADVRDKGKAVVYSWQGKPHKLEFLRIEPKDRTAKPCYLCTTEVSVGLFIDTMAAADRWVEASSLLRVFEPGSGDEFKGPRVWVWRRRGTELQVPVNWLASETRRVQHYADGLKPGSPSAGHPMQYLSPCGAVYFAWLMGCRLPASGEWQAAFDAHGKGVEGAARNLRDLTWKKQQDHVRSQRARNIVLDWPDAEVFLPQGAKARTAAAAAAVSQADDGSLWFAPVGGPDGFQHLAGNVAEFTFDRAALCDRQLKGAQKVTAGTVIGLLKQHAAALGVVGGSALSPPEVWGGKGAPFGKAWPLKVADPRDACYADVGFRLAFTAPRETAAEALKRILLRRGYLTAAQGKGAP